MAEHTPEPWTVRATSHHGYVVEHIFRRTTGSKNAIYVAVCANYSPNVDDEANAHFIAASPEMFKALAGLCSDFEQVVAVPTAFTAYNDAMSAIAKANGETA